MKNATQHLNPLPLDEAVPLRPGVCYCTMSENQWDEVLQTMYDVGFVLLVLDDEERLIGAFRKAIACG
jgi:hypothetical protein